jgi:hypothetical protein
MKKTNNKIVSLLAVFMIIPILFGYLMSDWFIRPTTKRNLSNEQIREISEKLKFELLPDETVYVKYFPGFLQGTIFLHVFVENIKSENDFLSRFGGNYKAIANPGYYEMTCAKLDGAYEADIFELKTQPKDYSCELLFYTESGKANAVFLIVGYIPELLDIYLFSNNPYQRYYSNPYFIVPLIIELALIICLVTQKIKNRRRQKLS